MSKMGQWIFDMQEDVDVAVMNGCKDVNSVVNYVHTLSEGIIDDKFIRQYASRILGYVEDGTSPGQAIYIANTQLDEGIPF
jgi:hypothetical protein